MGMNRRARFVTRLLDVHVLVISDLRFGCDACEESSDAQRHLGGPASIGRGSDRPWRGLRRPLAWRLWSREEHGAEALADSSHRLFHEEAGRACKAEGAAEKERQNERSERGVTSKLWKIFDMVKALEEGEALETMSNAQERSSQKQVGVTSFSNIASAKTLVLADMIAERMRRRPSSILVVGCGNGDEAGILARYFNGSPTVGVDIGSQFEFNHETSAPATLVKMDAHRLDFDSGTFDLVYSFHALEHMAEPSKALSEMARVLAPGGAFCVGTPNKSRLVGYVGSPVPFSTKIRWNLIDLKERLAGRWDNATGAHAGFSASELLSMCRAAFDRRDDVSEDYYKTLYRRSRIIKSAISSPLGHLIMPCCYVIGVEH